jgi:hypothetical protein
MTKTYHHHNHHLHHHHHHHLAKVYLGHMLTHSGLTHLEVSLTVSRAFCCPLVCSCLLSSVIYYKTLCLYVAKIIFCVPVFCLKLRLCLFLMQFLCLFLSFLSVPCCFAHIFHVCCYSSCVSCLNGPVFITV